MKLKEQTIAQVVIGSGSCGKKSHRMAVWDGVFKSQMECKRYLYAGASGVYFY